ncbi:hypothetical protein ACU4HD_03345 [Cupriavidus basilensis]
MLIKSPHRRDTIDREEIQAGDTAQGLHEHAFVGPVVQVDLPGCVIRQLPGFRLPDPVRIGARAFLNGAGADEPDIQRALIFDCVSRKPAVTAFALH